MASSWATGDAKAMSASRNGEINMEKKMVYRLVKVVIPKHFHAQPRRTYPRPVDCDQTRFAEAM